MKQKFNITGMSCSACSQRVNNALNKTNGIRKADVNLLQNCALVDYDENVLTSIDIIKVVRLAGYDAAISAEINKSNPLKKRLIVSLILLVPLMYLSMGMMLGLPYPNFLMDKKINYLLQMIVTICIMIANYQYFVKGFKNLFKASPNMDSLIAVSSSAAFIYGVYILILYFVNESMVNSGFDVVYFESAGMVLSLVTIGKFLEGRSKVKTTDAISKLIALTPDNATLLVGEEEVLVKVSDIKENDIVIVKDGETIPVDGVVTFGHASVDQAVITGESLYVDKTIGDEVLKSTVNRGGYIRIKALRVGDDTTYDKIIRLVDEASISKAPISRIADKVSNIFVPFVMVASLITFIIWMIIDGDLSYSLSFAIAVLVVSCPCALGLATPTAIMVSTLKSAENHNLIKNAEVLETASSVNYVLLDKTGTITEGEPRITKVFENNLLREDFLAYVCSLEALSDHPISKAILKTFKNYKRIFIDGFQNVPGRGLLGYVDSKMLIGGNALFMSENNIDFVECEEDGTAIYFAFDGQYIGCVLLNDVLKVTSAYAISMLNKLNIKVAMISGDNEKTARKIADEVGISEVYANVLPSEKDELVLEKQKEGNIVAFIGDGINDAVALSRANVAVAIGCGTDVAIDCADVVLVKNELLDAVDTIRLSKKTMRIIRQNLFWAFFYNVILIPVAAGALSMFGLILKPSYAALAMCISSITVVLNALRINKFKKSEFLEKGEEIMENKYSAVVTIEGMMCGHCKARVEKVLNELPGLTAKVDLDSKKAFIESEQQIDECLVKKTITDAGYDVIKYE